MVKKTQVQKWCEEKRMNHRCEKCGESGIRNGIFLSYCDNCGASIDISYLSALWHYTPDDWENLQAVHDKFARLFEHRNDGSPRKP